jgi:hypothetical protein
VNDNEVERRKSLCSTGSRKKKKKKKKKKKTNERLKQSELALLTADNLRLLHLDSLLSGYYLERATGIPAAGTFLRERSPFSNNRDERQTAARYPDFFFRAVWSTRSSILSISRTLPRVPARSYRRDGETHYSARWLIKRAVKLKKLKV